MSSVIPENDGPQPQLRIWGHDSDIIALAYLPDGRRVVSGSHDKTVKVWNLEHGEQEGTSMEHEYEVDSLAVTRDGTKIISGDVGGIIKVWDVQSHELVREWTHEGGSPNVAISPDDRFIAVGGCNVGIYTLEGSQVNHSIELDETVWSISFSPDGKKLACGTDNDLRVYDIDTGTLVLRPLDGQGGRIYSVLWSRGGRRLFSASYDKAIRCWDADTVEQIGQPRIGHTDCTHAITLSPDGSILASASWDNTVRFWYATSGRPFGQHLRHDEEVEAVCFSPSGEFVASGSRSTPGSLYLWRVPWLNSIKDSAGSIVHNLSLRAGDITPSVLPHFYSISESLPKMEGQSQVSTLAVEFPPPPDLTPDIIRIKNQYAAGGSFGDVYRCRYHGSLVPIEVAVKAFRFSFIPEEDAGDKSIKMLRRELGIWRRLEHNNIVPFLGIAYGFGMDGTMSLVSLWMPNESLQKFLAKYDNHLNVVHRLRLLLDIANGLHYLHSFPIVHGDLNCNNVLLDVDYTARLADFGYASLVGNIPEALTYLQRSTARPGALRWIAPEQIDLDETFNRTTKSDVYSFGCVALQVSSGKQPWSEVREDAAVVLRLARGHKPGRPESRAIDDSHWNLIQGCWSPVDERPTTKVIISTIQWFLSHFPQLPPLRDSLASSLSQTVNINTQVTGTMAESMYQANETQIVDEEYTTAENSTQRFGARTLTETREYLNEDRDDSSGQQFLEEELYKLRVKPGGSQSAVTHKTWEVARDDQEEYQVGHGAFTESGLPEIPDGGNYTERRAASPPLPPIPQESNRRELVPSQHSQVWNPGHEANETAPPPWQRIHQRLLNWAVIWPMSEIDGAHQSTTRGQQVDEVALSIWSMQTYKRYVRSRMTDVPAGNVDRLLVPPNMADAISTAVFKGRHGDACGMLRELWAPFGFDGAPRLIVVLAKHRSDGNHWVVHRFSLPDGALTTYDSYPERALPDGRPLGWWFAIRVAWPGAIYTNPDHLMQKMVRLHRPMQLNIDNSVAAAGIWRNVLMGSRAERNLDLERLRHLINTEVKNLRQRKPAL